VRLRRTLLSITLKWIKRAKCGSRSVNTLGTYSKFKILASKLT